MCIVISVITAPDAICRTSVMVDVTAPSGELSSYVTAETELGSTNCPWVIKAKPGQKINMTLMDFSTNYHEDQDGMSCQVSEWVSYVVIYSESAIGVCMARVIKIISELHSQIIMCVGLTWVDLALRRDCWPGTQARLLTWHSDETVDLALRRDCWPGTQARLLTWHSGESVDLAVDSVDPILTN